MQYQPDIHTISSIAPPSYTETMAQIASPNDKSYAPPYGQTTTTTTTTTYGQGSQMADHPSSVSANNFYSNIPSQPAYNPSYVPTVSNQQYCHTAAPTFVRVERVERLETRDQDMCCDWCSACCKFICITVVFTIVTIYLIKVLNKSRN
ncbi:uncharacterized protein LOC105180949 [Harpegnathos saltator]|uniref:uncharacterized protein LOC105180949 n=1 Tax=Harpegnathos saltator TaxID=610380 RepID=UPI00058E1627|nr:uncharacterized protein LOC105180949 [Harpegnathos saltator]XP_011135635.1 uncharacterized protein LOC105180949 [Harpegnathos saltator]XP_025162315.1 uncharacterized protein LOC105180949 [Harpegnathos saltator]XP_025162316.1 uncharacterized protein LOC105180949 [Harpegnathos saltator]